MVSLPVSIEHVDEARAQTLKSTPRLPSLFNEDYSATVL